MANITYQLTSAINAGFKEGLDKHSYRQQHCTWGKPSGKVFSYASRKELIQTATNFGKWLQKENPEIKYVYQISSQHVQEWLQTKVSNQQSTVDQYASRMRQIETLCREKFKTMDRQWDVKAPRSEYQEKLRDIVFKREHLETLMEYTKEKECCSRDVIEFASRFGARSEEIVTLKAREIDLKNNVIRLSTTKGGRARELPIKENDREFLKECLKGVGPTDRVFPIAKDTPNKWLHSNMLKIGVTEYASAKTGIHAIRKMVAQERYDECREQGLTKEQALGYVNEYLGHAYDRVSLNDTYIANQW